MAFIVNKLFLGLLIPCIWKLLHIYNFCQGHSPKSRTSHSWKSQDRLFGLGGRGVYLFLTGAFDHNSWTDKKEWCLVLVASGRVTAYLPGTKGPYGLAGTFPSHLVPCLHLRAGGPQGLHPSFFCTSVFSWLWVGQMHSCTLIYCSWICWTEISKCAFLYEGDSSCTMCGKNGKVVWLYITGIYLCFLNIVCFLTLAEWQILLSLSTECLSSKGNVMLK